VDQVVRSVCLDSDLTALLGSEILAQIWMQHLTQGIIHLAAVLREKNWTLVETEKSLDGTVAGFSAGGRIDLIFRNTHNQYILADIKTGKPKSLKNRKAVTIVENGLFQLPFYRNLAVQNGYTPLCEALYIHLMNNGSIELRSLTDAELETVQPEFETKVQEIVEAINAGDFHRIPVKTSWGARR
jgi:RecB family exonuclease